ncbi:MAG: hypothetical protein RL477_686 [Pseudomonadota bacterium]|jgi:sulfoxide reductase heme-binding subunit YedZ
MVPWCDRAGRLSWLKLAVFVALFLPALWVAWKYANGLLGPRPANAAVRDVGAWMIRFLFISLAVTPLREAFGWTHLLEVRRMIGVGAFAYGLAHITLFAAQESWKWGFVAAEIVRRIYLTIGFVGLAGLAVLAITSTDGWQRRLRANWQRLHKAIYVIAVLAAVHFFIQSKAQVTEPILMMGLYLWLMAARADSRGFGGGRRRRPTALRLVLIGAGAAVATALGEAAWYAFKIGASPVMVLAANLRDQGFRPAWGVAIGVGIVLLPALVRAASRRISARRPA